MRLNVRDGWWGDEPPGFPRNAEPVGYGWMVRTRKLDVMPNHRWSFCARVGGRHSVEFQDITWELFPLAYAPESASDHLEFALKYDGVNLEILRAWFESMTLDEVGALEARIRGAPTGVYVRRAWFLYELLTERTLLVPDARAGAYVPLLDPVDYFVGQPRRSKRHRVLDNLFGARDLCPVVRRTPTLQRFVERRLDRGLEALLSRQDDDALARVATYLYTKETRSTYEIEREKPTTDKAKHFVAILRQAHDWPSISKADLVRLQNLIVTDTRSQRVDYRDDQNYVGGPGPREIHFVSPRPEDLPPMMAAWLKMLADLVADPTDAVVAAAVASFAFVYLHPFEDGNGRIHRYLLHYVLARKRFTPAGSLIPVSATMLARKAEYDAALDRFSHPLMTRLRYELDSEFRVEVLHDSSSYYRYPDLTAQTEALYGWIARTIEEDIPQELVFILTYRAARTAVVELVELSDHRLEHFLLATLDQGGRLSKNKRKHQDFSGLSPEEIEQMEDLVRGAMTANGMAVRSP